VFFRNLQKKKITYSRTLFVTCLRTWTVQSTETFTYLMLCISSP